MKKKLERRYYKNMTAEEKAIFKQKRRLERERRIKAGEMVSSESDLSADELSDIDPAEYREFLLEKQQKRAERNMRRAAGEIVDSDSDDSDYWKETPGNVPLDMQKRSGFAQLLLPGPELMDISLPKDSQEKEKVLQMYAEVMKDQMKELDFDFDDSDSDFDEAEMEQILAQNADIGQILLGRGDLSPRTLARRMKKV